MLKMNIAMFGHKRIPSREGGVEVVVEELSVRMAAEGHSVTCYNRGGHHVSGAEYDDERTDWYRGVRVKRTPTLEGRGLAALTSSFFAALACAFGKYDVAHIHSEGPAFMCWIPKLTGKRVVVTIHGLDYRRAKWGRFASWYLRSGEKNAVRFADEIIVLSENMRDYFKSAYNRDTRFIPNGINAPDICEARLITERFALKRDDYLLSLGRIVPEKGLERLIRAFKQVKTSKKLAIAGGSSDTERFFRELRDLARDDERIIFTDFVQGRLKHELYSNCWLYVMPSDVEGMPISLLEAMSYGNCCVVSDIPECAEVVEGRAVTFPAGDADALAQTLQRLCDTPEEVRRYRKGAADYITGKYDWDDIVKRTLCLYEAPRPEILEGELYHERIPLRRD